MIGRRVNEGVRAVGDEYRAPVSAVLITKDASRYLDRVLSRLAWCGEILVLDSGSTDMTRTIAMRHGAMWHEAAFAGYGPQKRRATALARHDWVLSVDDDEILDDEACAALRNLDWSELPSETCGRFRRRPFVGGREIRHGHWARDRVVRLFNRTHHAFDDAVVHESVRPTGPVFDVPGSMLHFSHDDLASVFRPDYPRLKAAKYRRNGRRAPGLPMMCVRAGWAFTYSFFYRRGFLDGRPGLVLALADALNAVLGLTLVGEQEEASPTVVMPTTRSEPVAETVATRRRLSA
jgi:glycosyltransferase involved in cell wall biosynthesis